MLAKDLISDLIPTVTGFDTVRKVMEKMMEFKVAHLPVVDQSAYLGLITEQEVSELPDQNQVLSSGTINLKAIFVFENQHFYEVLDVFAREELTLLPVLSSAKQYIGCITLPILVRNFSIATAAGQPGAILLLSMAMPDYSPTILSKIIEDNSAKIISLYVVQDPNGREITVTLKVNTQETSSIMRSFDRYGYTVKSHFLANSQLDDFYRSRYEEFMNYMNI